MGSAVPDGHIRKGSCKELKNHQMGYRKVPTRSPVGTGGWRGGETAGERPIHVITSALDGVFGEGLAGPSQVFHEKLLSRFRFRFRFRCWKCRSPRFSVDEKNRQKNSPGHSVFRSKSKSKSVPRFTGHSVPGMIPPRHLGNVKTKGVEGYSGQPQKPVGRPPGRPTMRPTRKPPMRATRKPPMNSPPSPATRTNSIRPHQPPPPHLLSKRVPLVRPLAIPFSEITSPNHPQSLFLDILLTLGDSTLRRPKRA